ncbi:MAG: hypothetical protein BroJett013_07120 [Alphaproteobacteria bacterium]|nr:MAG: hypothetical protein BroJett013_07120 [Alphaproteobacteria bacterium]
MELVHAYAVAGHNNPPDEEEIPPKGKRVVDEERARQVLIAARQIKALFHVPLNRILEKRKGGEDGRALRRFLIYYARGLGSPVWECAEIFDLDRKQIGQEEDAYLSMLARNAELEEDVENMTALCDSALRVDCGRFIRTSLTEIQADAAAKKAIKEAREAAKRLAPKPAPKPKKKALSEAERIQREANLRHQAEALAGAIRRSKAIIKKAEGDKATKEQRKDAERARKDLTQAEHELELLAAKIGKANPARA